MELWHAAWGRNKCSEMKREIRLIDNSKAMYHSDYLFLKSIRF